MLKNRAIRLSLRDRIYDLLIGPDAGANWASAWNVYTEKDFRSVASTGLIVAGTAPAVPYVYLLDSFLEPVSGVRVDLMQPQVVFEIDTVKGSPNQLGDRAGRLVYAMIHIFGKSRAERDDLAGYFFDFIGDTIPIKDYGASNITTGVKVEDALVNEDRVVEDIYTDRGDAQITGFLLGWSRFSFSFRTQK